MAQRLPIADIEFIARFAEFCRSKGDEGYHWSKPSTCALGQFGYRCITDGREVGVPDAAFKAAVYDAPFDGLEPFSALADRLEALLVDAPAVTKVQS